MGHMKVLTICDLCIFRTSTTTATPATTVTYLPSYTFIHLIFTK